MMTMEEEKLIQEKRKQLRRSNDRLRMLESMEQARQEKVERELGQLMQEKQRKEQEVIRKREVIKQRKYMNANVGIIGDGLTSLNAKEKKKMNSSIIYNT